VVTGIRALLWLLVCWLTLDPARADQDDARLESLFAALQVAGSAEAAQPIEAEIWRIWGETSDPASARLMRQGSRAMEAGALPLAALSFNRLIEREPGFAEAWNKRATLHYLMGNYAASIDDIEHTLELEPRHFGALSGLGLIMLGLDRPAAALRSFEAALAVHPHLPGARTHIVELRRRLDGDPI
jgi:tetratricopeptide (TPR) repeat protein